MNREAWPPALLAVAGLVAVNEARRLRFGAVTVPGPGFFPLVLAVSFTLVCLILLVAALRAPASAHVPSDGEGQAGGSVRWKVLTTLGVMLVYAFALEPLGFIASTCGLLIFFFRALDGLRWPVAVAASILTSVVTYTVFKTWLQVRLPPGPWGL